MNKKQMLKEQKRLKEQRRESEKMFSDENGLSDTLKITIGVLLFIGISFAFINIVKGNWNLFSKSNQVPTEINQSMVIAGTMFNKEEGEYLVLAYDMQGPDKDLYSYLAQNYSGSLKLYYLDLSSGFNQKLIGDKTAITNDLASLRFGGPTLLVINKDRITASYADEGAITNYLNSK